MRRAPHLSWDAFVAAALAVAALGTTAAISVAGFSAQVVDNNNTFSAGTKQLRLLHQTGVASTG